MAEMMALVASLESKDLPVSEQLQPNTDSQHRNNLPLARKVKVNNLSRIVLHVGC